MSLFKRAHNDPRLGLERGRIEEVEVAKECDAVGRRREHFSRDGPLLRDHRDSSKRGVGGSQISGKRFLLTAALQIGAGCAEYHGPIDSITTPGSPTLVKMSETLQRVRSHPANRTQTLFLANLLTRTTLILSFDSLCSVCT